MSTESGQLGKKPGFFTHLLHETGIGEMFRRIRFGSELCEQVWVAEQLANAQGICAIASLFRSYTHTTRWVREGFTLNETERTNVPLAALTSS